MVAVIVTILWLGGQIESGDNCRLIVGGTAGIACAVALIRIGSPQMGSTSKVDGVTMYPAGTDSTIRNDPSGSPPTSVTPNGTSPANNSSPVVRSSSVRWTTPNGR